MGRKKTLSDITQYIIKSQSRVSFANKNSTLDSYSLDDITDAYLRAYRLKKHNILEQGYDIGLPGMLCYDLMLCANPYADLLKQYFFTLFSLETVAKEKDFWAKIYTYYLNNNPFDCIDTILQICYATPDVITDPNILKRITNYGLCLQLNSNPSPDNDLLYIQPDADSLVIVKKVLESNQVSIINRKMCEFQHAENQQLIVECVDLLDEAVAAATSNVDLPENDSVSYTEMIDAFLRNKHTSIQEYCNYIRILVINILSVPEMQYLYFISVTSRDNLQIGHYTYSSKIATSISNLKKLTVLSYAFIASVVETNLAAIYFRRIEEQKKQIQKESLKSAVSAIMTRNMSHNLGSHYLYYTKMQLEQLAKESGKYGPDIRGAAKVMGYMQGRMDYLATLISGERYPYGCVNFKSQIYDELTIDDFSKRHFKKKYARNRTTNFLLSNLIWSEGFTRSNIIDGIDTENSINVHVRYNNSIFTGSAQRKIANREDDVKRKLSEINIALPGGIMSCHAFFNIIENFIRNSAKYHQQDFQNKNLTTTIKISETRENNLDVYEFIIYDNKHNAYSKEYIEKKESNLITSIRNRLSSLRILDDNNAVEKSNKGFKEMLFSAIWMRSFVFMQDEDKNAPSNYSEVLAAIQSAPEGNEKLQLIEKYGFSIIAVNDEGEKCSESNETANLALRFTLPKFKKQFEVSLFSNDAYDVKLATSRLLNVYGEVVCVNQTSFDQLIKELNKKANSASSIDKGLVIPRMVTTDQNLKSDIEALKYVLDKRFGPEFEMYKISIENIKENRQKVKEPYKIYFQTHLSTQAEIKDFTEHAYADSISGGNFTLTLAEIFNRWKEMDWNKNAPEYYEVLKIKESALTRITLIDERLYNEMLNKDNGEEIRKTIIDISKLIDEEKELSLTLILILIP